jgi:hypothetical protein
LRTGDPENSGFKRTQLLTVNVSSIKRGRRTDLRKYSNPTRLLSKNFGRNLSDYNEIGLFTDRNGSTYKQHSLVVKEASLVQHGETLQPAFDGDHQTLNICRNEHGVIVMKARL